MLVEDSHEKKFDICRGSEITMDYGLQQLSEEMKLQALPEFPASRLRIQKIEQNDFFVVIFNESFLCWTNSSEMEHTWPNVNSIF